MKPGSDLGAIMNTVTRDTGTLAKLDIVWGDTKDVGKTETLKELSEKRSFVEKRSQTNILVMNVTQITL